MADRLHLLPKHRQVLEALLCEHLPDVEVWAYGSRVNGRSHDGSDLDLVLRGPGLTEIPTDQLVDFEEAVRESSIPFLVEARDWARLPERFLREIERDFVVFQEGGLRKGVEIAGDWRKMILGNSLSFSNGKSSPKRADDLPYPVYGSNGIIGFSRKINSSAGTIIIGRVGSYCGSLYLSDEDCWVTDNAIKATAIRGNDLKFFFYLLRTLSLNERHIGSGQPLLNHAILSSIQVNIPSLPEQRIIAHILGTLDDKIELNRRMNETLEAMARAIFKDWFVDFGPTRAKADGRDPYLAPEVWDLFPAALDDEGKPVGWDRGILAQIAESPRRSVSPVDVSEDTPYIGLEHMPRRSIALTEWEGSRKVSSNKSVFRRGEILFGKLRPYFHKIGFAPLDGICSTDIVVVAPREPRWSAFTLACLSSDDFVNYTAQTSTGTKMPRTSWKMMGQYNVSRPPEQIADAFQHIAQPLLNRMGANIHENRTLTQTRDLLLPKLVSGEIRIVDTEKVAEAVA